MKLVRVLKILRNEYDDTLDPPETAAGVLAWFVPQLLHHPRAQVLPEPVR